MLKELEMIQQNETVPYVGIDGIKKAMKAEQSECCPAPEEDGSFSAWVVNTCVSEERCRTTAASLRCGGTFGGKIQISCVEIIVSDTEAGYVVRVRAL